MTKEERFVQAVQSIWPGAERVQTLEEVAEHRHKQHIGHATSRPLSKDYELKGLRGEATFAKEFGLQHDLSDKPGGDGGVDAKLDLVVNGAVRHFNVDVKTAEKPFNLIVEVEKCRPQTIYVLAGYKDGEAYLIGWEWGATLLKNLYGEPRKFQHGIINHFIPAKRLRSLDELHKRRPKPSGRGTETTF